MGLQSLKNASWNVLYATVLAGTGVSLFTASYFLVDELQLRYRGNELIERCVHILEGDQCLARRIGGCPYAIFGPSDGRHRRPKLVSSSILNEEGTTKFIDGMFYVRGPESKNGFAIIKARSMLRPGSSKWDDVFLSADLVDHKGYQERHRIYIPSSKQSVRSRFDRPSSFSLRASDS